MIRIVIIAISFFTFSKLHAQDFVADTLYAGLNKASSFTVTNNAVYIVESGAHRVIKISPSGKLIEGYGNRGSNNYQFDGPTDIATTTGLKIYVSDPGNNRIQVFDKRWQYLSSIRGNEKFRTKAEINPGFLGVNRLGEIFFYDSKSKSLGKYDEDGAYLDQIPVPSEIKDVSGLQVVDSKIYLLDKKSGLIHQLSENGFYETYFLAEGVTAFFNANQILYTADRTSLKQQQRQDIQTILNIPGGAEIKDIMVVDQAIYMLTAKYLIKVQRK